MIKGLFIFGTGLSVGFVIGSSKSEKMANNLGALADSLGKLADALGEGPVEVTVNMKPTTPTSTEEKASEDKDDAEEKDTSETP